MSERLQDIPDRRRTARIAGAWYLLMALTAPIGVIAVPQMLSVPGDPTATLARAAASVSLIRLGIASGMIGQVAFVLAVVELYRLLGDVDRRLGLLMLAFVLVSVPVAFASLLIPAAMMTLLGAGSAGIALPSSGLTAAVWVLMALQGHGVALVEMFWGLWLLPLGLLSYRSGLIPKAIGVALVIAFAGYVTHSLLWFLAPAVQGPFNNVAGIVEAVAELSMVAWLLIWGVRTPAVKDAA
jgi:hypothetical protein